MRYACVKLSQERVAVIFSTSALARIQFGPMPASLRPGSGVFLESECGQYLLKIRVDRYRIRSQPLKWVSRLVARKFLFRPESLKEYWANQAMKDAGLSVVDTFGWGFAINPLNPAYSFYLMRHITNSSTLEAHMTRLQQGEWASVIAQIVRDIKKCALSGFSPSDIKPANLFLQKEGTILWIDTQTERLPKPSLQPDFFEREFVAHWPSNLSGLIRHALSRELGIKC